MVGPIALTLVLGLHILVSQCLAEGLHLLLQTVFGHQQGEVDTLFRLPDHSAATRPVADGQQMVHHAAAKTDDGRTLAIGVFYAIDVLGRLHTFLLHPLLDGLAQAGCVDESRKRAQTGGGLADAGFVLGRAAAKLRHLREAGVGHLGHEDATRQSVLYVVLLEALPQGAVGAQHGPVVGHLHHTALGRIAVVVLTPLALVERQAIDVVFRRPRPGAVGLAQRVEFLAKGVEGVVLRVLESLQQRRATHRHGHHANQHVGVVGGLLVGLPTLLALLPFLLALAGQGVLLVELALPHIDGVLHHTLVRRLLAADDRHQSQVLQIAVAIFYLHLVGIGGRDGQHAAEHGHVHRGGNTDETLPEADGQSGEFGDDRQLMAALRRRIRCICHIGHVVEGGSRLSAVRRPFQTAHDLVHHPRPLCRLLAGRVDDAAHLGLGQSVAGHQRQQPVFRVVADGPEV